MSDKTAMAVAIFQHLGKEDNIVAIENCMTRLRVSVQSNAAVDKDALQKIKGVMKVVGTGTEIQLILGPGIAESVAEELEKISNIKISENPSVMKKQSATGIFSFFSQVFAPLIPVFAGTGLLFGIMKLFTLIFNLTNAGIFNPAAVANGGSVFMSVLNVLSSTFFAYLNIAVAMQSAKVMGGNPYLGLVAGGIITSVGALNGVPMGIAGLSFLNGRGGTLAALAAGAFIAVVEKWGKKIFPDALKIHMPPLFAVVVVGMTTLYVLQPIGGIVSDLIGKGLIWMFTHAGALGGAIISGLFLPLVMTGMHHGLTPIHATLIQQYGYTTLYAFNSMAGGGQVGAAIALFFKYREYKALRISIAGGLPVGILGIGEPLIFGVTLPLGRAFVAACLGGSVGGLVCGLFPGMGAVTINVSGILGVLVNTRPFAYLCGYGASIIAGFCFTWIMGVRKELLTSFSVE